MMKEKQSYRSPSLTVDGILVENYKILLIKRKKEPWKGYYALPGGFVEYGETCESAIVREFKEETGLDVRVKALFGVYSDPARDPRGHIITIVYILERVAGELRAGDDAEELRFFELNKIPQLAADHNRIIEDYSRQTRGESG